MCPEFRQSDAQRKIGECYRQRERNERFGGYSPAGTVATTPKRYRFFPSQAAAYSDPIIGPLMAEEDEREREGLPPRFSLL